MNRKILIILNDHNDQEQILPVASKADLQIVHDIETAIEQLYKTDFDGVLYEAGLEQVLERKLLKIISLEQEPPVVLKKESWQNWEGSLDQIIKSIPLKVHFIDDGFKNAGLNICLN